MIKDSNIDIRSRYFLIFLIFTFGYFVYLVYSSFLFNIMIASLLIIGTLDIYNKINIYIKNKFISSTVLTLLIAVFFFFPIFYFINLITENTHHIDIETIKGILNSATSIARDITNRINIQSINIEEYLLSINPTDLIKQSFKISQKIGQVSVGFIANVAVVLVFYFVILVYKNAIGSFLRNIIPLKNNEQDSIISSLSNTMSVVYSSTIAVAFLEGVLFAIIMVVYGYSGILFGMLYGFASLIPVVGGLLIWVPVSLYELSIGHTFNAIVISLYTIIMISIIADTLIKPFVITLIKKSKHASVHNIVHEYIIFFAILAGMTSFGFWGIIVGPAVTTIFLSLLYIYSKKVKND